MGPTLEGDFQICRYGKSAYVVVEPEGCFSRDPDLIPHLRGVLSNPNCEYSFNVPALFTLAAWSHCHDRATGETRRWDPVSAAELAAPHFLEEIRRPTRVGAHGKQRASAGLSEADKETMEITKVTPKKLEIKFLKDILLVVVGYM